MTLAAPSQSAKPEEGRRTRVASSAGVRAVRALHKGQQTRAAILDAALALAAPVGLEGLSIGAIAEVLGMSKSGVFAHFGSREDLQIAVVREYHQRFERDVFYPALKQPRGLPRLRALFDLWVRQTALEIDSGCVYISGAVEFDDRPGPVRDELVQTVNTWQAAMRRAVQAAVVQGHLRPEAYPEQIAFEIHGLILALHYDARFLRNPQGLQHARQGFENLLARHLC